MEKDIFNINQNELTYGRGYVYSLQYHLVWCTKYRKKVLKDGIDTECKKMLQDLAEEYKFQILAMEVMPDHIHLLVNCKPQFYVSDMIKIMKGNLARRMFLVHPELKNELWGGHLWNPSYCAITVSDRSREQVLAYIEGQKGKEKILIKNTITDRRKRDADSIQLWCGITKTEYPAPPDTGDLPILCLLSDRSIWESVGRAVCNSGCKKAV